MIVSSVICNMLDRHASLTAHSNFIKDMRRAFFAAFCCHANLHSGILGVMVQA